MVPVWLGAGFADYLWHRHTRIETTSGIAEALMHTLMMAEAAPAVLAPLMLEVNAGVIAGICGFALVHELTVLWDLSYTSPRRPIPAGEQITHTFLESPPFVVAAAAIATHWEQFRALGGQGKERPRWEICLQRPFVPAPRLLAIGAAMFLLGVLPHLDELRRCAKAAADHKIGEDTPACLAQVY